MPTDVDNPNVVASQTFLNQGTSGTSATLFTPTSAGKFRVSIYITISTNASAMTNVSWTDENGSQSASIPNGQVSQGTIVLHSIANSAISVTANGSSLPTGTTYNLYSVVESLT